MIVVKTDRLVCIYVRTNRRVQWKYSTYGGRYRTKEEAIRAADEHMGSVPYEYYIEDMETGEAGTGFRNWPGHPEAEARRKLWDASQDTGPQVLRDRGRKETIVMID